MVFSSWQLAWTSLKDSASLEVDYIKEDMSTPPPVKQKHTVYGVNLTSPRQISCAKELIHKVHINHAVQLVH